MQVINWSSLEAHSPQLHWRPDNENSANIQYYALLDQCRIEHLMRLIYQSCDLPLYEYLYAKTDSNHLLDVSPVLLNLSGEAFRYENLIQQLAAERAGLIISSPMSLSDLANHLRRFLLVPDPSGESYLRFYDPAIWLALDLMQQTPLIAGAAIHDISLPYWLNSSSQHWVHQHYDAPATSPVYTGYDLNSGDRLDEVSLQTRLLYWVGQHDALAEQDWMMSEFLELFTVIQQLIARGVTHAWRLEMFLPVFISYADQLDQAWLSDYLQTCNISEPDAEEQLRHAFEVHQQHLNFEL